ncbi:MAG: flippase activity-associated protein Agl23 [Chloroflexia bacterium]
MESTINRRPALRQSVLDRAVDLSRVDWGVLFFGLLMVAVVATRFYDLGTRAMHHDESIHAYYSYQFLNGNPWKYDPAYHGPFLYHMVALGFFLFGTSDATARIMPAIFGVILVGMCWMMRAYIGRLGAIAAAVLVTFSPSIMYYSRSLRHDMFALVGTFMLFLAILGFIRTHRGKYLFLGAVGLGIGVTSHELIYINVGIFVLFLAIAWAVTTFLGAPGDRDKRLDVEPVTSALRALVAQRWAALGAFGVLVAIYVVFYTNLMTDPSGLSGLVQGIGYWLGQHGVARGDQPVWYYALLLGPVYEPLVLIVGTAFLIALGVRTAQGTVGFPTDLPLEDYPDRIDDRRPAGKAPSNYLRGMAAVSSGVDEYDLGLPSGAVMAGFTVAFLAFWGFGALVAYSLAGEKMPWLLMQIAFPFALLAGAGIGRLLGRTDWGTVFREGGLLLGALVILILFAIQAFFGAFGDTSQQGTTGQQAVLKMIILGAIVVLMIGGIVWQGMNLGTRRALRVGALTLILLLFAYEVRSSFVASFRNGDIPREALIYTQTSPEVPEVSQRVERLGRDLTDFTSRTTGDPTGGHGMDIALDAGDPQWPFNWYFRDQQKLVRYNKDTLSAIAPSTPIIIASVDTQQNAAFQAIVKGKYLEEHYKLRQWFPEPDYKVGTYPGTFFSQLIDPRNWSVNSRAGRYLLYRDPSPETLGSTDFYLYTRNDLVSQVGSPVGSAPSPTTPNPPANPPPNPSGTTYGMFDLPPQGNANGQFNQPRSIAIAPDGSYYVVDTSNFRVQKFDKTGKFVMTFGSQGGGDGQFGVLTINTQIAGTGPGGIAVDKSGNVYVADTWNHRVEKFDSSGKFIKTWGSFLDLNPPAPAAGQPAPTAAPVPSDANVRFYGPRDVVVGSDGSVYVSDTGNKRVLVFDGDGNPKLQIGDGAGPNAGASNGPSQLNEPMGLALDASDNLYITDTFNQRINVFDKTGKPLRRWSLDGWTRDAPFLEPHVALDGAGNVYVTDPAKQTVYKFDNNGKLLGNKNASSNVTLIRPTGLAVTKDGAIFVVDTEKNGVVQLGRIP